MPLKQNWTDRDTVTATFLNQLASAVNSAVASLAGKYTKPAGGIPASDLAGNVLDKTTADTIFGCNRNMRWLRRSVDATGAVSARLCWFECPSGSPSNSPRRPRVEARLSVSALPRSLQTHCAKGQ